MAVDGALAKAKVYALLALPNHAAWEDHKLATALVPGAYVLE